MKEAFVKHSPNRKREQSEKGTQEKKKSFLRNEEEELAVI